MNKRKVPKIRFKGFHDDWEQRKVGEVTKELLDYDDFSSGLPLLTSSRSGLMYYSEYRGNATTENENTLFSVVPLNACTYRHMSDDSTFHLNINTLEKGLVSKEYPVFQENESNLKFIVQYINSSNSFTKFCTEQKKGGTRTRLYYKTLCEYKLMMPSIKEQNKTANFFDTLDHLITLHQRKLELLKRLRNSLVDHCFIGEKYTMSKIILYHGSPNRVIVPKFGFGEDRHDYGRGFYLTENLELAKEWAVCRPDETHGWVHKYELEMDGLNILDFQKYDVLSWLAELMKHRDAADSRRYKMLVQKFIDKYGIDTCGYDVITGWRANASYFYIAKEFVRDNIDIEILEELLSLGGLGIQFCIKSERAFAQLSEVKQGIMSVDYSEFNDRYNERDINARNKMRALVDSDANKVTHVFSTLFER